jgi:hypothetical protein
MATTNSLTVIPSKQAAALVSSLSNIASGLSFFKKKSTTAALRGNTAATNMLGTLYQHVPQFKSVFQQSKTSNQASQNQPNNAQSAKGQSNNAANSTIRGSIKQTVKEHISGGIKGLKHKFGTKEGLLNLASGAAGGGIMSAILKESSDKVADSKLQNAKKEKFIARYLSKTEKGQELSKNLSKTDARTAALKVYEKELELLEEINKIEAEHKKLKAEGLEITEEELEHVKELEKQKADLASGKNQDKSKNARKEKFVDRYLSNTENGQELSKNLSKDDARAEALKVYEKELELLEEINKIEAEHKRLKEDDLEITEKELDYLKELEKQRADLSSGKIQNSNTKPAPKTVQPATLQPTTVNPTSVQPTNNAQVSNKDIAAINKQSRKTQKALNRASVLQKTASAIMPQQLTPTAAVVPQNSAAVPANGSNLLKKIYSSLLISNKELKKLSNFSKLQLTNTSKKPGFLNRVSNFASAAKEKGGSLLSSAMSAGSNIADAAKEKGGSLISSAGSGIGRAASSVASRFALPALAVAGAGAAGWAAGSMISNALPNLGSDIYDFVHGEPEKEKPYQLDPEKIAARKKKDAEAARSNFAKTDPRIVKPEVAEAAEARSNFAKTDPRIVKPEVAEVRAEMAKTDPRIVKPEVATREAQTAQLEQNNNAVEQEKQKNAAPIIHAPSSSPTTIVNNNTTVTGNRPDIRLQEPTYTQLMSSAFRRNPYFTI